MSVNITLTAKVLCPAVVIMALLILYFVTASKKNVLTEMNISKSASPSEYQFMNTPGPYSCDHCHLRAQPLSGTDPMSAASDGH